MICRKLQKKCLQNAQFKGVLNTHEPREPFMCRFVENSKSSQEHMKLKKNNLCMTKLLSSIVLNFRYEGELAADAISIRKCVNSLALGKA